MNLKTRFARITVTTLLVFTPLTLSATGGAQQVGGNIAYTYGIEELERRSAILKLSPGFLTILKFDEAVLEVAAGNPDVVMAEGVKSDPTRVILRPKLVSGRTDLSVTTETGRVVNFILNVSRGVSGAIYNIKSPTAPAMPAMSAQSLALASSASSSNEDVSLVTQLQMDSAGHLIVNYALNNPEGFSYEIASVRLLEAQGALPLRMENFESTIEAYSSQTGRAVLLKNPKAKLTLEIGLRNAAGKSTYLKRDLDVSSILKLVRK